jgi:hypothetical protein
MKTGTILLLAAGAYGIYTISRKSSGAKKLQFYPQSVDLKHVSLTNWTPDLLVKIVNPTYVSQNIDAVFLSVFSDDTQVGRIQITTPFKIAKLTDTVIKMPITIMPSGAGKVVGEILKGNKPNFSIKGTVSSMGVTIAIDEPLT